MDGTQVRAEERRSGQDRRFEPRPGTGSELGDAALARWPLDVEPGFDDLHPRDPWVSIVHRSISDYRAGRADSARQTWDDRIIWRVDGGVPASGAEGIFSHHRQLHALTDGTFRQRLVSLEASRGPIVEAHVQTTAQRHGRSLDIPSLIVFELAAMRIRQVIEMPGDAAAWNTFWAD